MHSSFDRKLSVMAFFTLIVNGQSFLVQNLEVVFTVTVEVLHENHEDLNDEQAEESQSFSGFAQRRKDLRTGDMFRSIDLPQFIRAMIDQIKITAGEQQFNQLIASVDPHVVAQLTDFLY